MIVLVLVSTSFPACHSSQPPAMPSGFIRKVLDTNPPVTPRSPEESMKLVQLPPGFHLELVASEPMVQEPVAMAWDGNGRLYVAEMNTFMIDANATGEYAHTSRIKLLEDTDWDGRMDKATVFADSLLLPRAILPVGNQLLVQETDHQHIWSYTDTNGDGRADIRKIIFRNDVVDTRNVEHQNGGLLWNLDNWIYPTRDRLRYKYRHGELIADTMVDDMIGQWGLSSDNYGRLFYSEAGPGLPAVQIQQMPAYGALNFADQYTEDFTRPWPIIGTIDAQGGRAALRPEDNTLERFTSGCGQSVFRGDRLPADMAGDYFIPEPVGRIIKRGRITNKNGKILISDVYHRQDWLASADMNFRPVNTYTGPDGCFYIVDMYHGIIQESEWTKLDSYLGHIIAQKELYRNRGMGRIYRVVHDGFSRDPVRPRMLRDSGRQLVRWLDHPNGWWRDHAQQEIIVRNDRSLIPALRALAAGLPVGGIVSPGSLARIHALWTLEGLEAMDKPTLYKALGDPDPQVRKAAIWIGEIFIRKNDADFVEQLRELAKDTSADVLFQLTLSLRGSRLLVAENLLKQILANHPEHELMQFSYSTYLESERKREAERQRTLALGPAERELVTRGSAIFHSLCATCHGADGRGVQMGGKPLPAPPLAGSPRVQGDKIMNIQILLNGLKGPIDGKTYPDMMPSMANNNDEWIAAVLSYIRNSGDLGNKSSVVTPQEVKYVRDSIPRVEGGMTLQTLEIFKLGRAESKNWNK